MGRMRARISPVVSSCAHGVLAVLVRWRVRIALGLAIVATLVGLAVNMSGSAPRLAGDDHVRWPAILLGDAVNGGGRVCVTGLILPDDAERMVMTIGNVVAAPFPLARITARFSAAGRTVTSGVLRVGATPGEFVSIPLRYPHGASVVGTLCLHVGGHRALHFGGEPVPIAAQSGTTVDGVAQTARPSILYYRPGSESWWQLLGALDFRFGLGKSPIFGDWTLPLLVLAMAALGLGVVRLLVRELR